MIFRKYKRLKSENEKLKKEIAEFEMRWLNYVNMERPLIKQELYNLMPLTACASWQNAEMHNIPEWIAIENARTEAVRKLGLSIGRDFLPCIDFREDKENKLIYATLNILQKEDKEAENEEA